MVKRRGAKPKNRLRAKRFEAEIVKTVESMLTGLFPEDEARRVEWTPLMKQQVGRMIKRLLDAKLLREQDFYVGDWVFPVADQGNEPVEVIDINYSLKTARIKDPKEGEIWVRFQDLIKDPEAFAF